MPRRLFDLMLWLSARARLAAAAGLAVLAAKALSPAAGAPPPAPLEAAEAKPGAEVLHFDDASGDLVRRDWGKP